MRRPARCNSTICRLNSGVYRFEVFDLAIWDYGQTYCKESVEAGPDQSLSGRGFVLRRTQLSVRSGHSG
jgi:hypothetical protein